MKLKLFHSLLYIFKAKNIKEHVKNNAAPSIMNELAQNRYIGELKNNVKEKYLAFSLISNLRNRKYIGMQEKITKNKFRILPTWVRGAPEIFDTTATSSWYIGNSNGILQGSPITGVS